MSHLQPSRRVPRGEAGQVSLIRMLVIVAVIGFILFEVGAVVISRFQVSDVARQAAIEANLVYGGQPGRAPAARERAREYVERHNVEFVDAGVDTQEGVLRVTAQRTAPTLVISRIERVQHYGVVRVTEAVPLRR